MTPCPACSGTDTEVFTTLRQLPVHGTVVCRTQEEARALAKADQVLAVCHGCAFVFNATFDPSLLDYSGQHEESQAASPTFRAFAAELARGWVDRYSLRGELVLEIGCGKGDFLGLLAQAGAGRAHGVDPGLDPARLPADPAVSGEASPYAPSATSRRAAAVVCRHTLEHVPDPDRFLGQVVQGIDRDRCRALLFEVPDLGRVLDEAAFWDLQYEHCSSFTTTSLQALFARHDLPVLDLRRVYADQYLVLEAAPGARPGAVPDVPPVVDVVARCRTFAARVEAQLHQWSSWFDDRRTAGRDVVVWGGGAKGSVFLSALPECGVRRVVDINPGLQGRWMGGPAVPYAAPSALRSDPPDDVLLMNPVYRAEVRRMLDDLGLTDVALTTL